MATECEPPSGDFDDLTRIGEGSDDEEQFYGEDTFEDDDSFLSLGWSASGAGSSVISNGTDSFDMLMNKRLADNYITEQVTSLKHTKWASGDTVSTEISSHSDSFDVNSKTKKLGVIDENSFSNDPSLNRSVSDIGADSISSNPDSFIMFMKKLKKDETSLEDDSLDASLRTNELDDVDVDYSTVDISEGEEFSESGIRTEAYDKRAQLIEQNGEAVSDFSSRKFHKPPIPPTKKLPQSLKQHVSKKFYDDKNSPPNLVDRVLVLHKSDTPKEQLSLAERRRKKANEYSEELKLIMMAHGFDKPRRSSSRSLSRSPRDKINRSVENLKENSQVNISSTPHHTSPKGGSIPSVIEDFDFNDGDISTLNSDVEKAVLTPKLKFTLQSTFQNETKSIQHNPVEKVEDFREYFPQQKKGSFERASFKEQYVNQANKDINKDIKTEESPSTIHTILHSLFLPIIGRLDNRNNAKNRILLEDDPESNDGTKLRQRSNQDLKWLELLLVALVVSAGISLLVLVLILLA